MAWALGKISPAKKKELIELKWEVKDFTKEQQVAVWGYEAVAQEQRESSDNDDVWVMIYADCDADELLAK